MRNDLTKGIEIDGCINYGLLFLKGWAFWKVYEEFLCSNNIRLSISPGHSPFGVYYLLESIIKNKNIFHIKWIFKREYLLNIS